MKVGIAVRRWSSRGGLERNVLGLARHLVQRGHRVEVVTQRRQIDEPGVHVHPLTLSRLWPAALAIERFSARASKALEKGSYDVTFASGHIAGAEVARLEGGLTLEYRASRPSVAIMPREWAVAAVERERLKVAKVIVTLSNCAARTLETRYGIDPARIRVVRNGVDLDWFDPQRPPDELVLPVGRLGVGAPPAVAFVGSGYVRKGLRPLIEALEGLRASLIVAGTDPESRRYVALARRCGVDTTWLGHVEDVRPLLSQAQVVAVPSLYDPFGLVVLEGLAMGKPVVTTRATGASEISPFEELVVEGPTRDALRGALVRAFELARSPETIDRARRAAGAFPLSSSYEAIEALLVDVHRGTIPRRPTVA